MALTTATPDAVSGSIQGIFLYNIIVITLNQMPPYTKLNLFNILYLRVHTVVSSKCGLKYATKSSNSELTRPLRAKKGIHSHILFLANFVTKVILVAIHSYCNNNTIMHVL